MLSSLLPSASSSTTRPQKPAVTPIKDRNAPIRYKTQKNYEDTTLGLQSGLQ